MAEYTGLAVQTVNAGDSIIFTSTIVPCTRGFIRHSDSTGSFVLSGYVPNTGCRCRCNQSKQAIYLVDFGANIAIPTGGEVGAISLALTLDNAALPASTMIVTPAAVEQYFNVSRAINALVYSNCCSSLTVKNISDQPILVQNANIIFARPDLTVTR